jgi:hypothetical protein
LLTIQHIPMHSIRLHTILTFNRLSV